MLIFLFFNRCLWDPSFDEPIEKIIRFADIDMYADKKKNQE